MATGDGVFLEIVVVKDGKTTKKKILVSEILGDVMADFCVGKKPAVE